MKLTILTLIISALAFAAEPTKTATKTQPSAVATSAPTISPETKNELLLVALQMEQLRTQVAQLQNLLSAAQAASTELPKVQENLKAAEEKLKAAMDAEQAKHPGFVLRGDLQLVAKPDSKPEPVKAAQAK